MADAAGRLAGSLWGRGRGADGVMGRPLADQGTLRMGTQSACLALERIPTKDSESCDRSKLSEDSR